MIKEAIKKLQQELNKHGFNAGSADGILGPKTKAAINKFKQTYDLPNDEMVAWSLRMLEIHKAEQGEKVSEHFYETEFACHGDGLVKLDPQLIVKLELLRNMINKSITITSGYRSPAYNKKIGGAPKSQHMEGKAADIKVPGISPKQLAVFAEKLGFGGIGIYKSWIHVDVREGHARWKDGGE